MRSFMETHGLGAKGIKMIVDDVFARASFVLNAKVLDLSSRDRPKKIDQPRCAEAGFQLCASADGVLAQQPR